MQRKFHIGMRKIKSLYAVVLSFVIWQTIRLIVPTLEVHPIFAYIYAILEIRVVPEETTNYGKLRIKSTLIGLAVGLIFVWLTVFLSGFISNQQYVILTEFVLILVATLVSLCVSEVAGCESFCGVTAIITVICMVTQGDGNVYLYAVMRVIQTLIGVFSAVVFNVWYSSKKKGDDNV